MKTFEKKAHMKNGIARVFLSVLAISLEIAFVVALFTGLRQYAGWIRVVEEVMAVLLVIYLYGTEQASCVKLPWIMLILAFPVFGVSLYVMIGLNGPTNKMRQRYEKVDRVLLSQLMEGDYGKRCKHAMEALQTQDPQVASIAAYLVNKTGIPIYQNSDIVYFDEAAKALSAMKESLAGAKKFIFMEYFAIEQEGIWQEILDILVERVKAGVEVRVFYDDIGSIAFVNTDFASKLNELGILCRVFNPFVPGLNFFLNNRDHRKITVIDGYIGFTGGFNLANEYFNITHPYGYWKDTGVMVKGEAVRSMTATFLENWNAVRDNDRDDVSYRHYLECEPYYKSREDAAFIQPYADRPMDNEQVGEEVYISMANKAISYCWFVTPYLILTDEMTHALSLAAKRGVDVRIITPGIPDKRIVYAITRSFYHCLIKDGVRIYEYTPGFCHCKMSITDGVVATCGSINLDYRSLYHHFENGCLYAYGKAVEDTRKDFVKMMEESNEVTEQYKVKTNTFVGIGQRLLRLIAPLI